MNIGVIGCGLIGSRMALNWQKAGHQVTGWNRTRAHAEGLGFPLSVSPLELAQRSDAIMIVVADPPALRTVVTEICHTRLDGKVVMIPFRPWNVRQVGADMYTCNLDEGANVALLRIPGAMYRKWWVKKGTRRPGAIYVRVSRGTLVNSFGVEQEGAILQALGSDKSTDIRGRQNFTW